MKYPKLEVKERDLLLSKLSEDQRFFLQEQMKRGRKTKFANILAKQKGIHIPEDAEYDQIEYLLDEWIYIDYIDAGYVSKDHLCECGRPLRYQHKVQNKTTGEIKSFGIDHLEQHVGIDAKTVKEIKAGFDAIDYELDEILIKINQGWNIENFIQAELLTELLDEQSIPDDIFNHLRLELPLLDRQVNRLKKIIEERREKNERPLIFETPESSGNSSFQMELLFDHFDNTKPFNDQHFIESKSLSSSINDQQKQAILSFLNEGVQSARIICELLIEHHNASEKRYLSGKPHIYFDVCKFIESLDNVKINQKSFEDRYYTVLKTNFIT